MKAIIILSFGIILKCTDAVHVIWDNTIDFEGVDQDPLDLMGRMDEIRIPNRALIYPGTLWCGAGNISTGLNDFGNYRDTDKCCRNHDLCPNIIPAYQTKYNLTNPTFFTRLICDCDDEFRKCLKSVNKIPSKSVGFLYFTALGQKCFKKDYPISSCEKFTYFPKRKCVKYQLDTSQKKIYQWFDLPNF